MTLAQQGFLQELLHQARLNHGSQCFKEVWSCHTQIEPIDFFLERALRDEDKGLLEDLMQVWTF